MPAINTFFKLSNARSAGFESYEPGDVAYVTNGLRDNGIIGYVKPLPRDKVFRSLGICVSAFGEATVQLPPFVARGNGGSGLIVLEPLHPMTLDQLGFTAAYLNAFVRWRFSWYRQGSAKRLRGVELPDPRRTTQRFTVGKFLPVRA